MKFSQPQTLKKIAGIIGAEMAGDENFPVLGANEIHRVTEGDIVFVNHPKYYEKALNSAATVILIDKKVDCPKGKALLISRDPFEDFNKINRYFTEIQTFKTEKQNLTIGKNSQVHSSVIIGNDVKIGDNCLIFPNVVLGDRTEIGCNVIVQAGTVIGGDAFYYNKTGGRYRKMFSVGKVVIEDGVEIGANCTIDRGVTDVTLIGEGSKLDNQIQIGHDTRIGKNCLIASQSGIAGCCNIEDDVVIWGQAGVASGLTIGKGAVLLAKTGVNKSLKSGKTYFGIIPEEFRNYLKKEVILNKIVRENL